MTTEKAFEKLMNTPCWFALVGVTSKQAAIIKRDYKNGMVKFNRMNNLLILAGGVYSCICTDNNGNNTHDSIESAFEFIINRPLWHKPSKYQKSQLIKKYQEKTLTISTMVKVLKECGFTIKESWHLPPEINKAC